ncbi:MAG: EamA family transporter [Ruminococcaceae bacterium]|nr:EamA family transporter [Oscillospiraceae bacterium]
MKKYLPHICILVAGISWGMIGLFTRQLLAVGFTPAAIVLTRNMGGLLSMTLLFFFLDRGIFRIRLRHLPFFLGTGVVSVVLFTLLYFSCQEQCSLAVAAILLYTAPAFVMLMSAVLFHEPITKQKLLALLMAFTGCAFVSGIFSGGLSVTGSGLLMGIGSAFFYALYSIFARYALRHYQPLTVTYYTFLCAGLASLFVESPSAVLRLLSSDPAIPATALGLVLIATVLPFILYTRGLVHVESGRASILASIEPVAAALVGVLAFAEPLSASVLLGLGCVLCSVYILR